MAWQSLTALNLVATVVEVIGGLAILIAVLRHLRGAAMWCGSIGSLLLLAAVVWVPAAHLVRSSPNAIPADELSHLTVFLGGAAEGMLFGVGMVLVTAAMFISRRQKPSDPSTPQVRR